jgi:hypothetical protein
MVLSKLQNSRVVEKVFDYSKARIMTGPFLFREIKLIRSSLSSHFLPMLRSCLTIKLHICTHFNSSLLSFSTSPQKELDNFL